MCCFHLSNHFHFAIRRSNRAWMMRPVMQIAYLPKYSFEITLGFPFEITLDYFQSLFCTAYRKCLITWKFNDPWEASSQSLYSCITQSVLLFCLNIHVISCTSSSPCLTLLGLNFHALFFNMTLFLCFLVYLMWKDFIHVLGWRAGVPVYNPPAVIKHFHRWCLHL